MKIKISLLVSVFELTASTGTNRTFKLLKLMQDKTHCVPMSNTKPPSGPSYKTLLQSNLVSFAFRWHLASSAACVSASLCCFSSAVLWFIKDAMTLTTCNKCEIIHKGLRAHMLESHFRCPNNPLNLHS